MFNAINLYSIGRYFHIRKVPILPKIFLTLTYLLHNSVVPLSAKIHKSTKFAYGGIGVVIHKDAEIGKNCVIGQNVTIGGNFDSKDRPKFIGDNVYIGAGSRILNSTIGDNVVIGVNSVVVGKEIPNDVVIAGSPARIIGIYNPEIHKW